MKKIDYDKDRLLVDLELDDRSKVSGLRNDKLFDKASILSISKLEYYVEKEVERKKERKPDPGQDSQDQDGQNINIKLEDKYEIVKEKVKKKAYKYLVKLEIRN